MGGNMTTPPENIDPNTPILHIENLCKTYPNGAQALRHVNFKIKKGTFLAVIGLSGSGKSSLLRCINRIHEPTSGEIYFEDQSITQLRERELRRVRTKIGMIFQHFNLINRKPVLDNVLYGRLGQFQDKCFGGILKKWPEEWIEQAHDALNLVGIGHKAFVRADGLSGGEKQRVAIARTFMQQPELLLADEPVASLDPNTSHSVMDYLKQLNIKYGMTIVCSLHFLSLVREYSTHVIALRNGEKVFEGEPSEITNQWFKDIYGHQAREVQVN